MPRRLNPFLPLLLFFACRGSQPATPVTSAVFDSLLALHAQHAIAEDLDGVVNGYTEDAVVRSNHMEPLRGRDALRSFFTGLFGSVNVRSLTYRIDKVATYGDSAWLVGTYELSVEVPGAPLQSDHGSVFALWVRDSAGVWRIHDDVVNSSVPLPGPPPAR